MRELQVKFSQCANNNSAHTIVFLHGNSSHLDAFSHLIDELKNCFSLLFINLPGHGESLLLKDYSIPNMAKITNECLKKFNISMPILAGHSLGGHIAIHLTKHIEINSLILINCSPLNKEKSLDHFYNFNFPLAKLYGEQNVSIKEINELFEQSVGVNSHYSVSQFAHAFWQTDINFRTSLMLSLGRNDFIDECDQINKIKKTVHIILGEDDLQINCKHIESLITKNNSLIKLNKVKNAKHFAHISSPSSIINILNDQGENKWHYQHMLNY